MAMTQLALLFMGALAFAATLGLFYNFRDQWTGVLVSFASSALWGVFAMSSYDVIVTSHVSPPVSEPIMPLVIVGIGFSIVTGLFAMNELLQAFKGEAVDTTADNVMGGR